MYKHLLVTVLCLATIANANSLADSTSKFLQNLHTVQRRQSSGSGNSTIPLSDFPQQCQSGCAPAVNKLNTCTTTTDCICTREVDDSLQGCLTCSVKAVNTTDTVQSAQAVASAFNTVCSGSGLSSITVGGATATGSASATSSQTLSGNATATNSGTTTSGVATTFTSATGLSTGSPTQTSLTVLTTAGTSASAASTSTARSAGIATASANVGYLSFTVVVTFLAALMA
ncbi:hypothetical protein AX14_012189 [Amanita brunnescens Koide BX004]|nr:hypothetical protein AX14_012189 [Amanita brunnescens Koide BX004]